MKGRTIVLDQRLLNKRKGIYKRRLDEFYTLINTKITHIKRPPPDTTRCLRCKRPFEVGDTIITGKEKAYHLDCYYEYDIPDEILEEDDYFIENGKTVNVRTLLED